MRLRLRSSVLSALLVSVAAPCALAAPGSDFKDGDFFVVSHSLPDGTPVPKPGILRVDGVTGATQFLLKPVQLGATCFDPFRRRLVVVAQPTAGQSYLTYFVDADGNATPNAINQSNSGMSSAGDGRIYFLEANGTANYPVRYIDAGGAVHNVLKQDGSGPLNYVGNGYGFRDFYFEKNTNSLWIATLASGTSIGWTFGYVAAIDRIPLDAAGVQATGPMQTFPIAVPVINPVIDSYAPNHFSAAPGGKVMLTLIVNGATLPFNNVVTIDPATMTPSVYSSFNYAGKTNSGCYSHLMNAAVELDTFTDTLRVFHQGQGGAGSVFVNGAVSSVGGTDEITRIFEITGSTTGLANYGTGTPGCSGPLQLSANQAPAAGAADFRLLCTAAPVSNLGLLLVTDSPDGAGSYAFGLNILFHVSFVTSTQFYSYDMFSNAFGVGTSLPVALSPFLIGQTFYAQSIWYDAACAGPSGNGLSSSNGLALTIQ